MHTPINQSGWQSLTPGAAGGQVPAIIYFGGFNASHLAFICCCWVSMA